MEQPSPGRSPGGTVAVERELSGGSGRLVARGSGSKMTSRHLDATKTDNYLANNGTRRSVHLILPV